jgi:hypothetical protein
MARPYDAGSPSLVVEGITTLRRRRNRKTMRHYRSQDYEALWNKRFEELKQFWRDHGHSNVPRGYDKNKALASWVSNQRHKYKNYVGKKGAGIGSMIQERIKKLESVGFEWELRNKRFARGKEKRPPVQPAKAADPRDHRQEQPSQEDRAQRKRKALAVLDKILIGARLDIFWPLDSEYYSATVTAQTSNPTRVSLLYDDGNTEWIDLTEHDFKLLPGQRRTKRLRLQQPEEL